MSRRRVLTIAASVGVGGAAASVAGLSLAGENTTEHAAENGPLVLSLRDARKGTFDLFTGGRRVTVTDAKLAARLLKAAKGR